MVGRLPRGILVALVSSATANLREVVDRDVLTGAPLPGISALSHTTGWLGRRTALSGAQPLGPDVAPALTQGDAPLGVVRLTLGGPLSFLVAGAMLQRRVLEKLTRVAAGSVMTCGELAKRAGAAGAARAVAHVLARSVVARLLLCRLVVPSSGRGVGGYGRGTKVKQALRSLEGMVPA